MSPLLCPEGRHNNIKMETSTKRIAYWKHNSGGSRILRKKRGWKKWFCSLLSYYIGHYPGKFWPICWQFWSRRCVPFCIRHWLPNHHTANVNKHNFIWVAHTTLVEVNIIHTYIHTLLFYYSTNYIVPLDMKGCIAATLQSGRSTFHI